MNPANRSPLTRPSPKGPLITDEESDIRAKLYAEYDTSDPEVREAVEREVIYQLEQKKLERISELGGRIYDIAVPGGKGKPEIHPVFDMIMKMRGEMMAYEPLTRRSEALAKETEAIGEDFDISRLEKLSGDPAFIKKLLRQEEYEEEFKKRYKSARRRNEMYRDDYKGKKTKEQLKTEVDEKLMAEYKEQREEVAKQLSNLYAEMASINPKHDVEIKTEWFDALDTHEYPQITMVDIDDQDVFEEEDEEGDYARTYKVYERDVYIPKNAPFKLIYKHTTEVKTYAKDEDGDWDWSRSKEEDLDYDEERGYYLVRK